MTREEAIKSALKYLVHKQQEQGSWGYSDNDDTNEVSWNEIIEWIDQQPCGDLISRQAVLDLAESGKLVSNGNYKSVVDAINEIPAVDRWIHVTLREMTPEERELYNEYDVMTIYDCELPDDGQEVLITTSWGAVEKTTFRRDDYNICEFEDYDEDDVIAWMPLPIPYKEEE